MGNGNNTIMKNILFYTLLCFSILVSCTTIEKKADTDSELFIVTNDSILNNIKDYYDRYLFSKNFNNIVTLELLQKGDTNIFYISHEMSLYPLVSNPPIFFCKIDNIDIAVRSGLNIYFECDSIYVKEKLKSIFPTEYSDFERYGDVPIPATFHSEKWILKFIKSKFLNKEIKR